MNILNSLLKKVDREIKLWFNREDPYKYKDLPNKYGFSQRTPLCPVCETPMKHDTDYMEHILLEEHMSCPNHCYGYEFVTGSSRTLIGGIEFYEHYADSKEEREHIHRLMNLRLMFERRRYREQKDGSGRESAPGVQDSP